MSGGGRCLRTSLGREIQEHLTNWTKIQRGVRQGCVLSPDLFALYGEIILRSISNEEGIKMGGRNINNIRYADDTVLIADSEEKLQNLVDIVNEASEAKGLRINIKKTETLVVSKKQNSPQCSIEINSIGIKQVNKFVYLGSTITADAKCNTDIDKRIAVAKKAFTKMRSLLTNERIGFKSRLRFLKTYVWSTLLYGNEAWTISKGMQKKLEATEMWFMRRMLRIPWTAKVTNQEVLNRANSSRSLIQEIRGRQLSFLGHILRRREIEHLSLTGKFEGRRARGRQRQKYLDRILEDLGGRWKAGEFMQLATDRRKWHEMIAHVQDTAPW